VFSCLHAKNLSNEYNAGFQQDFRERKFRIRDGKTAFPLAKKEMISLGQSAVSKRL